MTGSIDPIVLPLPAAGALLDLHRNWPERYPVLLESAASSTAQGRYSILMARPAERIEAGDDDRFLPRLDDWYRREFHHRATEGRWPFAGGWFLLLGYELAAEIEPTLRLPASPQGESSIAWRMRAAVIHDHQRGETAALAEPGEAQFARQVRDDLMRCQARPGPDFAAPQMVEDDPQVFLQAVRGALEHIAAGDIYQANLSRAWRGQLPEGVTAADVYSRLRRTNPGPFAGIAQLGELAIVSSSPERLVRTRGRHIETRPIAGTRPRLADDDHLSIDELIGNPKERAEHIMLIDLERNDLGRLCEAGTVRVDERMVVESYAHVHHIVSNVTGTLRKQVTPGQVVRALFPGGTITGCPKVSCMQLIGDLERTGRGVYTGSMGYLGLDGDLDLNILIRTLVLRGGCVTLRTGGGIVADSDPQRELDETRAKARGVLAALGETGS